MTASQTLRFYLWSSRFYLPRKGASFFLRRSPGVRTFSADRSSELARELGRINVYAPTTMCSVFRKYGSDKGGGWHNYTTVYASLFASLRRRPLRIFELGLGSNRPEFAFGMGADGRPGASLRAWRELFPAALIYGADIDRGSLFSENRIKTFYCDQLDGAAIQDLWSQRFLRDGMDIIIDDGLHTFEGNISFLDASLQYLRPGGIYVVEDIHTDTLERWRDRLDSIYVNRFPQHEFALVQLPNASNLFDNNLLIVRRRGQSGQSAAGHSSNQSLAALRS